MKRGLTVAAACALLMACGGAQEEDAPLETRAGARPEPAIVEGCLTAADNRFVLTQLRSGEGAAPTATETYQLINADDQLREHVGRQVRISGEAEAPDVATLNQDTPSSATAAGTSGGTDRAGDGAAVETQTQTRLEMTRMRVISVTPTGDGC